jgi:hypothetical protein
MVDVLVFTPKGCYLVEIKSWAGEIGGDAGTWEWVYDGRRKYRGNPRILAERKAKKLASLLKAGAISHCYVEEGNVVTFLHSLAEERK